MRDKTNIDLVSSEVAGLWTTYVSDTMAICTLKQFLNTLHDEEIRHILEKALNMSNSHIRVISEMFEQEGLPIPKGFSEDDVDINAPKLFTDPYYLFYQLQL
jgi:ferritin-like protein